LCAEILKAIVFFTDSATISAVGKARNSAVISLDMLNRQTALLDGLFASVPEAIVLLDIVLLDIDDRVLRVNPEFTRVFGYAQEEACGRLIHELIMSAATSARGPDAASPATATHNLESTKPATGTCDSCS
jgi:PAS domain-containing protein